METPSLGRREFLGRTAGWAAGSFVSCAMAGMLPRAAAAAIAPPQLDELFPISLAQWSLHKALRKGALDNLGFPQKARSFGIEAVEYVNAFFKDKADDAKYLAALNQRCKDAGVQNVLIMCDGEGALGDPDAKRRQQAVENHHRWVTAAKTLGCHAIRVNAQSRGSYDEQQKLAADGLQRLCAFADQHEIDVIVENHGGLSSNGKWLSGTLKKAAHKRVGALPDFGNFRIKKGESYDRYQGVDELMPYAKGVSAKSHDFDEDGFEVHTDYRRMLDIVCVQHSWRGHIGIEYEGQKLSEDDGIRATKKLLERVRSEISAKIEAAAKAKADKQDKEGK
ncbi:MAG: sugar phosphate isomerase/epimerase family protein [Planctomycetota bacterium]